MTNEGFPFLTARHRAVCASLSVKPTGQLVYASRQPQATVTTRYGSATNRQHKVATCVTFTILSSFPVTKSRTLAMKYRLISLVTVATLAFSTASTAFAQNTPGVPGGILDGVLGTKFQINPHPDMPFAAKPPTKKYQNDTSAARKRADDGDPDGCNLQCPSDSK